MNINKVFSAFVAFAAVLTIANNANAQGPISTITETNPYPLTVFAPIVANEGNMSKAMQRALTATVLEVCGFDETVRIVGRSQVAVSIIAFDDSAVTTITLTRKAGMLHLASSLAFIDPAKSVMSLDMGNVGLGYGYFADDCTRNLITYYGFTIFEDNSVTE